MCWGSHPEKREIPALSSFFGSDGSFVLQFAVIFAVILGVLTAGVLLVRRFGGGSGLSARPSQRARQPRLGIVDVYELDRQRQLILLRRDNVEHLLLVGGPNDVVIERNIQRGQRLPTEQIQREEPAPEPVPAIEARRPEAPLFEEVVPSFEMPAVVAAPVPGSSTPPPSRRPLADADIPPEPRDEDEVSADLVEPPAPVPPPAPAPEPQRRFLRRSTPTLVNPKPDVASERVRSEPTFSLSRATPPEPATPPVSAPAPRAVDAAILSDMARQLEIALSRPASAVTPPPGLGKAASEPAAPPPAPEPSPEPPVASPQSVDPIAAAMAGAPAPAQETAEDSLFEEIVPVKQISPPPVAAPPPPEPVVPEPPQEEKAATAPLPAPASPEREEPVHAAEAPAQTPTEAAEAPVTERKPEPAPPAPPTPKEAPALQKSAPNPFSVEEIEAEFARLLGRPLEKRN